MTERQWLKAVDNSQDLDSVVAGKVAQKHGSGRTHIAEVKGGGAKNGAAAKPAKPAKKGAASLNNMLMQLRKVCNHPYDRRTLVSLLCSSLRCSRC